MTSDTRLAELLLRWQAAQEQGKPVTVEELCGGDADCEAQLRQQIDAMRAMQWMEQVQSHTTKTEGKSAAPNRTWQPGEEPVRGYRLVKPLGRGGFSEVWQAEGPSGIPVALKLVFAERSMPEVQSLELLKSIRHPRIVSIFGAWPVENGFALAMELADESLHERWLRVASNAESVEKLSREALLAGAEALDFLNSNHRIQHRDVKPQNLLMFGDYIKLADFGIAKVVEDHSTGHTGYLTVAYAPPEFFKGRSATTSDQYSLAVTYTLLRSGKLPFPGNSAAMTYGHLHSTPNLSGLPDDERGAVARALSKEPRDRWPNCQAFAEAVCQKRQVILQPRTRRQLLKIAAVAGAAAIPLVAWRFAKPTPLKLIQKFDLPPGKNGDLYVRNVAGSVQAVRQVDRLLRLDYYVVGNGMGGAYIWDGDSGGYLKTLTSEKDGVGVAIPSNEEPWCLTGHNDGSLIAWDLVTGKLKRQYDGHKKDSHVISIDITADTFQFVTGSTDGTIKTWECSKHRDVSLKPVTSIEKNRYVMGVRFLNGGTQIASIADDELLQIWNPQSKQLLNNIKASSERLWALDIRRDGKYALTGGEDAQVNLWNLVDGTKIKTFVGHEGNVACVSFTAKKDLICSGSSDGTLRFWDISSGREVYRASHDTEVFGVHPANYRGNGGVHLTATTKTVYAWEQEK